MGWLNNKSVSYTHLDVYKRQGQHCAKLLVEFLQTSATLRASLYLYNTKEEADRFLDVLAQCTMERCLDIFF